MGDDFLRRTFPELQDLKAKAKDNPNLAIPYVYEYYMVHPFTQLAAAAGVKSMMARTLNALAEAMEKRPRLPRLLIILMDIDLIADFDLVDDVNFNPKKDFNKVLTWFTKQVNIAV